MSHRPKTAASLVLFLLLAATLAATPQPRVKIGFIVKQPEEPWFQNEWKFAEQAGNDYGFDVIKIGATDGEKVLTAIDNIAAQGAQGFIICTPDVMLGTAIVVKAKELGLKVFAVDDRLVDADGRPIVEVPYMGISSRTIGATVGQALVDQMTARSWRMEDAGAISISVDELTTARERNEGTISVPLAAGFPPANVFSVPQLSPLDVESGYNAAQIVLTQHPRIRKWLIFGLNDETVLGGVRATENRGLPPADVVAVGIGGQSTALIEFPQAQTHGLLRDGHHLLQKARLRDGPLHVALDRGGKAAAHADLHHGHAHDPRQHPRGALGDGARRVRHMLAERRGGGAVSTLLALFDRDKTWIALLVFVVALSIFVPFFLTASNLVGLMLSLSMVGMDPA